MNNVEHPEAHLNENEVAASHVGEAVKDRRRSRRLACDIPVEMVSNNVHHKLRINQISNNGFSGVCNHPLEEDLKFLIEISLHSKGQAQPSRSIRITGIVLRVEEILHDDKKCYNIAVLFINMNAADRKILAQYIKEYDFDERKNTDFC